MPIYLTTTASQNRDFTWTSLNILPKGEIIQWVSEDFHASDLSALYVLALVELIRGHLLTWG